MVHFSFLFSLKPKGAEQETKNKFELSLESHTSEHYSISILMNI
jgi:hypothetical protein